MDPPGDCAFQGLSELASLFFYVNKWQKTSTSLSEFLSAILSAIESEYWERFSNVLAQVH